MLQEHTPHGEEPLPPDMSDDEFIDEEADDDSYPNPEIILPDRYVET